MSGASEQVAIEPPQARPMAMVRPTTGNYKTVARRTVRDRWVWLVLGIVVLVGSLFVAVTAHASFEPVAPSASTQNDALVDMVRTSGPAGGFVLILGWFIRTWQADTKAQAASTAAAAAAAAAKTEAAIEKLRERIEDAHNSDGKFSGELAVIRSELAAIVHRLATLERRSSGSHRRASEE